MYTLSVNFKCISIPIPILIPVLISDVNGLLDLLLVIKYPTGYQLMMSLQPHDGNSPECKPVADRPKFGGFVNVTSCNLTGTVPFISTG